MAEHFDGPACPACKGTGELRVEGYSINPGSGYRVVDPQEERSAVCHRCWGTGVAGYAAREGAMPKREERRAA